MASRRTFLTLIAQSLMALNASIGLAVEARPMVVVTVMDTRTIKEVFVDMVRGLKLAAETINKNKRLLNLTFIDSEGSGVGSKRGAEAALKLGPDFIIGEVDSSNATIVGFVSEAAKVPMIAPFATSPLVTKDKKYVFRACFADDFQGATLGVFAYNDLKARKVAVLHTASQLYSETLYKEFKSSFQRMGGSIVYDKTLLLTVDDFAKIVAGLEASGADLIFLPLYEEMVTKVMAEAVRQKAFRTIPLLGGDGWALAQIFSNMIAAKHANITAYWVLHHDPEAKSKAAISFLAAYRSTYGEAPNTSAAFLGYDALMMAYQAFTKAGGAGAKAVAAELSKLDYDGPAGHARFESSQSPKRSLYILKYDRASISFLKEIKP